MFQCFHVIYIYVAVFLSPGYGKTPVLREAIEALWPIESARVVAERVHLTAANHLGPLVPRKNWHDLETYEGFQVILKCILVSMIFVVKTCSKWRKFQSLWQKRKRSKFLKDEWEGKIMMSGDITRRIYIEFSSPLGFSFWGKDWPCWPQVLAAFGSPNRKKTPERKTGRETARVFWGDPVIRWFPVFAVLP